MVAKKDSTIGNTSPPAKVEYLKLSPASSRYHRVMALAAALGCSWQDIIWEAIDQYLKQYSPKKV